MSKPSELRDKYSGVQLREEIKKAHDSLIKGLDEVNAELRQFVVKKLSRQTEIDTFSTAYKAAEAIAKGEIEKLSHGEVLELHKIYSEKGVDEAMLAMKENKLADLAKATSQAANKAEYASKNAVVKFFTKEEGGLRFGRVTAVTGAVLAAGTGIYLLTHKKKEPESWADKENTRRAAASQAQPSVA